MGLISNLVLSLIVTDSLRNGIRKDPILIGYTNRYEKMKGYPSYNSEVYGTNWSGNPSWCIARFDYDNEKRFSQYYVENYLQDLDNKACGWIDWMLAETYGEGYTIYLNGKRNQKSLGSCAMDGNRFPKLKYRIYQNALWVPYSQNRELLCRAIGIIPVFKMSMHGVIVRM